MSLYSTLMQTFYSIKLRNFEKDFYSRVHERFENIENDKNNRAHLAIKAQKDIFQRSVLYDRSTSSLNNPSESSLSTNEARSLSAQALQGSLIVPTPSAGSTALHNILSETAGLYVPWKDDVDAAISTENMTQLSSAADLARENALRLVIVQHGYIAGTVERPDASLLLKTLCDTRFFIHSVRDPIQCFLSSVNNELIQFIGAGSFGAVVENSCFGSDPIPINKWDFLAPVWLKRSINHLSSVVRHFRFESDYSLSFKVKADFPKPEWVESSMNHASKVVRHFRVGSHYAQTFKEWIPIDVCTSDRVSIAKDIEKLSRMVGAKVLAEPFWASTHATRMVGVLGKNKMRFNLGGFITPPLGLGFSSQAVFNNIFQEAEIAWLSTDFSIDTFPELKRLCITVDAGSYLSMQPSDRNRLMHPNTLKMIVAPLIYFWIREAAPVMRLIDACRVSINDINSQSDAMQILYEDTELFCERFPEYCHRWADPLGRMRKLY